MGQLPLTPTTPTHLELIRKDSKFVLVTNEPCSTLRYDPAQSYMVSFGIDLQTSSKFRHKTLGPTTAADAREVVRTMERYGVIRADKTAVYIASRDEAHCTAEGMHQAVLEHASKVGEEGLFMLHFSGHGISVRGKEWGLAPVDFDYSRLTYLTASVLYTWLQEARCKAKHILFTLDCCYAGGIANELTSEQFDLQSSLYVVTACTAYETSLVIGPLGHSIFTYFWTRALRIHRQQHLAGILPIRKVFEECHVCSLAFSSLLVTYDSTSESLEWKPHQQPELKVFDIRQVVLELEGEGEDQVDAAVGRFQFVTALYDSKCSRPLLNDRCIAWLESLTSHNGPLIELERKDLLSGKVLEAAVCSMLYSIASILMACDRLNVGNPNLFLTAFMHAVATVDLVHSGIELTPVQFVKAWAFYDEVLKSNKENDAELRKLYSKIVKTTSSDLALRLALSMSRVGSQTQTDGESDTSGDFTDSGVQDESEVPQYLEQWIPDESEIDF